MTRVFSGIQPTGSTHLGNYLGALVNWVKDQDRFDCTYCVVDLHAVTLPQEPDALRRATLEMAAALIAVGIDPQRSTLFVQSQVPEHPRLAWLLQCTTGMGELRRMTQFKDKSLRLGEAAQEQVPVGLFTYPDLQAADILLHDAERVPVGQDQKQHIELTRDVAQRFNSRYGEVFVIPEPAIPAAGARVMDLQNPTSKMSKSADSPQGTVELFEAPSDIAKKFKRAVTDSDNEVRYDPVNKPGVSNLLSILAAATDSAPEAEAERFTQYGPLKQAAAEAVIELVTPIQARYTELLDDRAELGRLLAAGADKAAAVAAATYQRAAEAMGFLAR